MIRSLKLHNFKNFQDATLHLGPLTVLIGANAAGKSNIRDAFRFLHGIGRRYSLAEILGEKYSGGERIWSGIRGGTQEVAYSGSDSFGLDVRLTVETNWIKNPRTYPARYALKVQMRRTHERTPRILSEALVVNSIDILKGKQLAVKNRLKVVLWKDDVHEESRPPSRIVLSTTPAITQLFEDDEDTKIRTARSYSRVTAQTLESFRFLDLSPTQMRIPSLPGQITLGDRGENLSSVLFAICEDAPKKEAMLEWVRRLTPMDVEDLEFDHDASGKVSLRLKERSGHSVSVGCASDGTLRFLGILAALFGPNPARFYFIEELENGIHPTRLGLLVELIEQQTKRRGIQVVATCHAPLVLQYLSEAALDDASIVYRLPDRPDAQIKRIVDVPEARRVIREQGVALLHASNWFEDVLNLTEDEATPPVPAGHAL